jgi:ferritin-like metal-binding protein YciE
LHFSFGKKAAINLAILLFFIPRAYYLIRLIYQLKFKQMETKKQMSSDMPNAHLHELFVDELRDILGAEKQLLKGLKKISSKTTNANLKHAFDEHLIETEHQVERLTEIFQSIGLSPRSKKCKAMQGLLEESEEIIDNFESGQVLDAALIAAAQKIEHYEIASYGCLLTYAKLMEHTRAEELLNESLIEEKAADVKLTEIAMAEVNVMV